MKKVLELLEQGCDVAYHNGGLLSAGDDKEYNEGWLIFIPGIGAYPVQIINRHYNSED